MMSSTGTPATPTPSKENDGNRLIAQSHDIWGEGNFPQGCQFSPDGLCLLTNTVADAQLRLYNTVLRPLDDDGVEGGGSSDAGPHTVQNPTAPKTTTCASEATTRPEPPTTWQAVLAPSGGDAVRSYEWYPLMQSSDPASSCFAAAARDQPVHLYDAYTGVIRASYRPYNALDEMESPAVVTFSPSGQHILATGFKTDRTLHVFDVSRPGRDSTLLRLGKTRRSSDGQKGLISALAHTVDGRFIALGTYSPGSIYVYDDRTGQPQPSGTIVSGLCVVGHGKSHGKRKRPLEAVLTDGDEPSDQDSLTHVDRWVSTAKAQWFQTRAHTGVTQLQFAPNQAYLLYSTSRRSNNVLLWDLRMLSGHLDHQATLVGGLASFPTINDTNQRLEFDLSSAGEHLYVGGKDGCVRIYETTSTKLIKTIKHLGDAVNGISWTRIASTNRTFLAVASGSRQFPSEEDMEGDVSETADPLPPGALRLYELGGTHS